MKNYGCIYGHVDIVPLSVLDMHMLYVEFSYTDIMRSEDVKTDPSSRK